VNVTTMIVLFFTDLTKIVLRALELIVLRTVEFNDLFESTIRLRQTENIFVSSFLLQIYWWTHIFVLWTT